MRNIKALRQRRQTIFANNNRKNKRNLSVSTTVRWLSLSLVLFYCCVGRVGAFVRSSTSRSVAFRTSLARMSSEKVSDTPQKKQNTGMIEMANEMNERAKDTSPFTEEELDMIITSLQNISPEQLDWKNIRQLLSTVAHLSHKDWDRTGESASLLRNLVLTPSSNNAKEDDSSSSSLLSMSQFQTMFERIMTEGNWYGAAEHTTSTSEESSDTSTKPWVVLVTGVNGIRKTTSVYQSWFPELLEEALVSPPDDIQNNNTISALPTGKNSFFRQLDHMIISLTNEDFKRLYQLTSQLLTSKNDESNITQSVVDSYSELKAALFTRFRTLSEILGVLLVREAQNEKLNVMIETSGRDIAMFHYVDKFFPSENYNKLALHFFVDDLSHAESSVDQRMVREIKDGIQAKTVQEIIHANAGGPYGSSVLKGVQADSDRVWDQVVMIDGGVEKDWYKASIRIDGHASEPWTACAIRPDGSHGTTHTFQPPKHLQQQQ